MTLGARRAAALLALVSLSAGCASPEKDLAKTRDPDNEERVEGAVSLGARVAEGDPDWTARREEISRAIRALLDDKSALVRQAAVDALALIERGAATGALADRLRDRDPWVRYSAAKALGRVGTEAAAEPLGQALRLDESADVRAAAADALRRTRAVGQAYELYLALREITGKDLGFDPRAWREAIPRSPPR
jgi:HEAT repeat protein